MKPAGTQRWRELLFLHWTFPVDEVRRLVPEPLEIDTRDGRAWVGLVPFVMKDIRSSWMPRGVGLDFLETNVRTYVKHKGTAGVYFFSLEASSWLAVKVARVGWGLPYFHANMATARDGDRIRYRSTRRARAEADLRVEWEIGEHLGASQSPTLEHFLLERYILYSFSPRGTLMEGKVEHRPYPAQRVILESVEQGVVAASGLVLDCKAQPETAHYAEGVDVDVFGPWPAQ